jgi:uncharacterized protein YukE
MKRFSTSDFANAIISMDKTMEPVRNAFSNLASSIEHKSQSVKDKQEKLNKDMADGARITKHKFRI